MTRQSFSPSGFVTCVLMFALASLNFAGAQTEAVLHSFRSTSIYDGTAPMGALVADKSGALYGTATGGGKYDCGAIFKLSPPEASGGPWTPSLLYSFLGSANGLDDGSSPSGNVVLTKSGDIYGTTISGGRYNGGTVYELSPPTGRGAPWTETVLYSFAEGSQPFYGIVQGAGNRLFGTTMHGGSYNAGTAFAVSPPPKSATLGPRRSSTALTPVLRFLRGLRPALSWDHLGLPMALPAARVQTEALCSS